MAVILQTHNSYLCFPTSTRVRLNPPNVVPSSSSSLCLLPFQFQFQFHRLNIKCSCSSPPSSILAVDSPPPSDDVTIVDDNNTNNNNSSSSSSNSEVEVELSSTRLLAQNVPWSATVADIRALFQQHGSVLHVELSMYNKTRNRGLAFVEMGSPEEASQALANLENFEFQGRTLKLNYAKARAKKASTPVPTKPPVLYNLFVANLPFEARAKDVRELFQSGGSEPFSADVIFHDNPRKASGYGFVSFKTKKEADEALLAFEGKELLGRPIRVARSRRFVKLESEAKPQSDEEQDLSADSTEGSDQPEASET